MDTRVPVLGILTVLALSGCGTFDPQPNPTRFYLMSAIPDSPQGGAPLQDLTVGIGPVWFAPYLDQQKLVSRVDENRVEFAVYERWAERFSEHFTRVVAEEIANLAGPRAIASYPWMGQETVDLSVSLAVYRFDRLADGGAEMEVDWQVHAGGSAKDPVVAEGDRVFRQPATPTGAGGVVRTDDTVVAMSRMVAELSATLAEDLIRSRGEVAPGSGR